MININSKEQFNQDVLQSEKPVLVDFYADWCGPCKAMAPLFDEMDKEDASYSVGKVNVDELPDLAVLYRVASIPTVLAFRNGDCIARSVGVASRKELEKLLEIQ